MMKAGQAFENLVTREQKVFNQMAYEPNGMVLDIECDIFTGGKLATSLCIGV
jgi:hypothetical protein